ncbi:MAG: hypothetical protein A2Y63_06350 [Candidatus Riflebacteria bacterium RBG_13_59_9]|nr:MAG: hypothetical protein A2Y63_06350 [Candidatus Riflebacteria bacterium RBG_13_59_9]
MLLRLVSSVVVIGLLTGLLAGCNRPHTRNEAALLEEELTQPAANGIERSVKQEVSTTGRDIQTVTLVFLIAEPVFDYRDRVNSFLLGRGYCQALNVATPSEFNLIYDGLNGFMRVQVLAEVALPPASEMTQIPPLEPPEAVIPDEMSENEAEPTSPAEDDYHRITLKISY